MERKKSISPAQLISAQELLHRIGTENLILLDASKVFNKHQLIPGAIRFDLPNAFSDNTSPFPNTLPSPERFQEECQKLGINSSSEIVVYDNPTLFNSARVWYLFRSMGHHNVRVLDGGMQAWLQTGGAVQKTITRSKGVGNFRANFSAHWFKNISWVKRNTTTATAVLIDARSAGRFNGTAPEPRQGLRSGSIPNSCNLPFGEVLDNGYFKSEAELKSIFAAFENGDKPFVFSCGSGVTACILLLAATIAGYKNASVYDGSWTEWASLVEE